MPDTMINTDNIFATTNTTDSNSILPINDIDITINHAALLADMEQLFTEARPRLLRLACLNGMTRSLVEMCYLAELPQREAAMQLGLTIGALELRLHRVPGTGRSDVPVS